MSDENSLHRSRELGKTWQIDRGMSVKSTSMVVAESLAEPDRVYCAIRKGQVFGTEYGRKRWHQYQLADGLGSRLWPVGGVSDLETKAET